MPAVFERVSVYPLMPEQTLIEWELHPMFNRPAPYEYEVQFSVSGNPDADDEWETLASIVETNRAVVNLTDTVQRAWSTAARYYFRVKLVIPSGDPGEYYISPPEPGWGSLDRNDRLVLREIYRQACLRMKKKTGSGGLLLRRKSWGVRSTDTVDPETNEVLDPNNEIDYGTGFVGGYWYPFVYWVSEMAGETDIIEQDDTLGTLNNIRVRSKGLAFPLPRTNDVWINCTTGNRYYIGKIQVSTKVRHLPAILNLELRLAPRTDIIYSYEIPSSPPDSDALLPPSHWFTNHWNSLMFDSQHWFTGAN